MYTQCPECQTIFRVNAEQLKAAQGRVRCGQCLGAFDALSHLVDHIPSVSAEPEQLPPFAPPDVDTLRGLRAAQTQTRPPGGRAAAYPTAPAQGEEARTAPQASPTPAPAPTRHGTSGDRRLSGEQSWGRQTEAPGQAVRSKRPPEIPRPARRSAEAVPTLPSDLQGAAGRSDGGYVLPPDLEAIPRRRRFVGTVGWGLGMVALTGLLAAQYAYHNRTSLSAEPEWRPWLERLCAVAQCELPPRRAPEAIGMLDRTVQSHPRYRGALLITATLVNRADFPQPYPRVEIVMSDLNQQLVARRTFDPEQYLAGAPPGRFPAGGEAHLMLEVTDPGNAAVGFEFNFL